jgi:hypothetical protein
MDTKSTTTTSTARRVAPATNFKIRSNKMKQEEMTKENMFDYLIDNEIATKGEIQLVIKINGYNEQSLIDIIEVKTGYDFDQHQEEQNNDLDNSTSNSRLWETVINSMF